MVVRAGSEQNIKLISVTFLVSNFAISSVVIAEQLKNMKLMSVTFCVLKFETSSVVRARQSLNMPVMFVTLCVSKFDKLSVVRAEQPLNMRDILVTFSVFRYSMPSMVVRFLQPQNHKWQFVGRALANEASKTTFLMIFAFDPSSLDLYQPGAFLPSFSANAPAGLLVSCLNVSVFVASSNTAYDSASWANAWLP